MEQVYETCELNTWKVLQGGLFVSISVMSYVLVFVGCESQAWAPGGSTLEKNSGVCLPGQNFMTLSWNKMLET